MGTNTEPYYRKKGNKIIIEQKVDGKTKYLKTLPDAKTLINSGRLNNLKGKASFLSREVKEKEVEKFGQGLLPEALKNSKVRRPTQKEINSLYDLTK